MGGVLIMKISNISAAYEIYKSNKPAVSGKKEIPGAGKDEFKVSDKAREMQFTMKAVSSAPDIREDRVAELAKQINEGSYNIDTNSIADKILSNL